MAFTRRTAAAALAILGIACLRPSRAEQVLVASLVDDIVYSDLISSGDCYNGCHREEHAVAFVSGTPQTKSCQLQQVTPFDQSTPEPGLLRASVYCEDSTGALVEEGVQPCIYSLCVDFAWKDGDGDEDGELSYDIVINRTSKPRAPHTVYVDLSVAVDPTASTSDVDSCAYEGSCTMLTCDADEYTAEINLTDTEGDGWVGGVDGYYNTWSLTNNETGQVTNTGTLADNHDSATIKECLAAGEYVFMTTATASFAEDMGWNICGAYGGGGEGLRFTVADGVCDEDGAEKIPRAEAEETEDASDSYCTLPAPGDDLLESTCVRLSSGLKIDGVGLYYDERCERAEYSGCGARSIDGCRMCFYDKEMFTSHYPNVERMPDWEDCPCCVADTLGVECTTAGGGGGVDDGVIIGISVGIVGVIAIACCLSCAFGATIARFFRRLNKRKENERQLEFDINGAAAFPDSPSGGDRTIRGTGFTNPARGRGQSGHFPIPRFDSIRGRFDSGIFTSNAGAGLAPSAPNGSLGAVNASGHVGGDNDLGKVSIATDDTEAALTAQSTPNGTARSSPNAPRSTVLDERLVAQGFATSDVGRPISGTRPSRNGGGGAAGWGIAMSGEYPDLEGTDPYTIDNAMAETGTNLSRPGVRE